MFFSTREKKGIYNIILSSIIIDIKKKFKIDIKNPTIIKKKLSASFIVFTLKNLFLLNILTPNKIVNLKYRNCHIGRHILGSVYRDVSSHKNVFNLYFNLIKNYINAGLIVDHAYKLSNKIKIAYIDHSGYLNGLYFRVFAIKKKIIYTNNYPRGLFFINYSKKVNKKINQNSSALKLFKNNEVKIDYKKTAYFLKKIIKNPKIVPWMKSTKMKKKFDDKFIKDYKSISHIIYAHSFTDGQMWFGYDGFINLKNWLIFTIQELKKTNNKIIVKAHPNFFNKSLGEYAALDKKIFYQIKKKYESDNIIFITEPIENNYLLNKISKETILISHHGTALLEGLYSGFKCISSESTSWSSKFKVTNLWNSQKEYKKLLNRRFIDLKLPNKKDLYEVCYKLFLGPTSEYSEKYWYKIIKDQLKKKRWYSVMNSKMEKKIVKKDFNLICKKISKNIEEIQNN